ncbi:MAG: ABC transporter ATP-binding protein [Bacteroidia bacterium]|nr:ABC transporter ATP-binding protein [Bacteroidia bacterium]
MSDSGNTIFALRDVCFAYNDTEILHDVRVDFTSGSFTGVIGRNGAGKTTLFRLLTGELHPQRGTVALHGRDLHAYAARERARLIAVVPQNEDMVFPFTVRSMVLLGRGPHLGYFGYETQADIAAAERAMELAGVAKFAARKVTDLSGGELHRVLIARALAQETPILLLDEPNAHLDLRHQVELFELLSRLHMEGRTILCITHDLNLAAKYCKRLIMLDEGRTVADGSPYDVLTEEHLERHFGVRTRVTMEDDAPSIRLLRGG